MNDTKISVFRVFTFKQRETHKSNKYVSYMVDQKVVSAREGEKAEKGYSVSGRRVFFEKVTVEQGVEGDERKRSKALWIHLESVVVL